MRWRVQHVLAIWFAKPAANSSRPSSSSVPMCHSARHINDTRRIPMPDAECRLGEVR